MALGIAADVIADLTIHGVVVFLRHAFAALTTALAIFKKADGGILDGKSRGIAPKRSGAHLAFGGNPEGIGVCTENLDPGIVVMESAEDGERFDASGPLNRASNRCIFVQ